MLKRLRLFGRELELLADKAPDLITEGITNELEDGYYVLFIDYDDVDYFRVLRDLRHLNIVFGLCSFGMLCNGESVNVNRNCESLLTGNYNVIGLDKLTYWQVRDILCHVRCDEQFKDMPKFYSRRNWVLRTGPKVPQGGSGGFRKAPVLKEIIHFPDGMCRYEHSSAMRDVLEQEGWFGGKVPDIGRWDGLHEVETCGYATRKKVMG